MAGKTSSTPTVAEAKNRLRSLGKQHDIFPTFNNLCRRIPAGRLPYLGMAGMALFMGMAMGFSMKFRNKIFKEILRMIQE